MSVAISEEWEVWNKVAQSVTPKMMLESVKAVVREERSLRSAFMRETPWEERARALALEGLRVMARMW